MRIGETEMLRDPYAAEREIMEEEQRRHGGMRIGMRDSTFERCVHCGYEILGNERAAKVNSTGDVIHEKCWTDYAEDNFSDLCEMLGTKGAMSEETYI